MNKASAMAVLQSRLDQLEMAHQAQMNAKHTQSLTEIGWGNQIRTYVLHVCSGIFAAFINFLKCHASSKLNQLQLHFLLDAALSHG